MRYLSILMFSFILNTCYSQKYNFKGYCFKAKEVKHIILLSEKVGYYYSGPDLLIDEVFTYELIGDDIIRNFHEKYSLRKRVDTLKVYKSSLEDSNGFLYREINEKKTKKLIKEFIMPSINAGYYKNFLETIDSP